MQHPCTGVERSGVTGLGHMLATLEPIVKPGEFVFVCVDQSRLPLPPHHALVREAEGTTLVMLKSDADAAGLHYDFVAAWITLSVHSALGAVGLTGAFSKALTEAGVSCNVLAGFFHDHLLVPSEKLDEALAALGTLRRASAGTE